MFLLNDKQGNDCLVVITCSKNSLHKNWNQDHTKYFDLCLLVYDDSTQSDFLDPVSIKSTYIKFIQNSKWYIIYHGVTPNIYSKYSYIGIMDEDMETTPENLNNIFTTAKSENFDLFTPALTSDSYRSHWQTVAQKHCDYRIVNTVEQMNPFFSLRAYKDLREEFIASQFCWGYGLEYSFETILDSRNGITKYGGYVAIIDKYPVKHTRPIRNRLDISEPEMLYYQNRNNRKEKSIFLDYNTRSYNIRK